MAKPLIPLLLAGIALAAGEPTAAVAPALPENPKVIAALDALGDNSACVLEKLTVRAEGLGDFNKGWHHMHETGPNGRDYSVKMAWMPDRRRAFYCGANHGAPHRMNDAWEFDLAALSWNLLYAPDYNDSGKVGDYDKSVLVLQDGWLRTRKGGPAHPAHTWWGLTYDPVTRQALWLCAWPSYRLAEKLTAIGATADQLYKGPSMWSFQPQAGTWNPLPTAQPWPRNNFGASLEYVPEMGGTVYQFERESWLLDSAKAAWKRLPDSREALPIETLICHDPGRKLLIAQRGAAGEAKAATWHYPTTGAEAGWTKVVDGGEQPLGHDARAAMYFDPVGKVALLYETPTKSIWSYTPDTKHWAKLSPAGSPPPFTADRVISYLDPARNVFVVIGTDKVWCYRYKRAD